MVCRWCACKRRAVEPGHEGQHRKCPEPDQKRQHLQPEGRLDRGHAQKRAKHGVAEKPAEAEATFQALLADDPNYVGADKVLFASDCPFDKEKGPGYIRSTIAVLESIEMSQDTREKISFRNAQAMFGVK